MASVETKESRALTTEGMVLKKLRSLPPKRQREVLDFVESLGKKRPKKRSYPSLCGLWADLNVDITEEDIAEARKEMWGNFPREDI